MLTKFSNFLDILDQNIAFFDARFPLKISIFSLREKMF